MRFSIKCVKGFSLIELVVVVAILTILLAIGVPLLTKYIKKYNIEKEIVELYSQLNSIKFKSMNTGTPHGIRFDSPKQYTIFVFKDSNYNLKFDGVTEEGDPHTFTLKYNLDAPKQGATILFDKNGISRNVNWGLGNLTIYINYPARHNCITVSGESIKMGEWNGSKCIAK